MGALWGDRRAKKKRVGILTRYQVTIAALPDGSYFIIGSLLCAVFGAFFLGGFMDRDFHREWMALEWASLLRLGLLVIPSALSTAGAWWSFSEQVPLFVRVSLGVAAGMCWYLVLRQLAASAGAFRALELMFSHWSDDRDVDRILRLGVSSQLDDRLRVVEPERVIPVTVAGGVRRTMSGYAVDDLAYFVERSFSLGRFGTSERNWMGHRLPSGRVVDSVEDWRGMLDVFARVGLLVDVGVERKCARWVVHRADEVKVIMGLPVAVVADGLQSA